MKRMSVKEIQDTSLALLKHIEMFCKEHNIRWYLDSGTLIGAMRHKGFIPWDDDADIVMPRPDYNRFMKEYVDSKKYKLFAMERNNCFLPYAKICEMEDTYYGQHKIWTMDNPGVSVDILPLDGAPDTEKEYLEHAKKIVKLRNYLWKLREAISPQYRRKFRKDPLGFAKDVVYWVLSTWRRANFERLMSQSLKTIRAIREQYGFEESKFCHYIAVTEPRRKYWKHEWFSSAVYVDFCDTKFPVPVGYDDRLAAEYGNWRTPPPRGRKGKPCWSPNNVLA